MILKIENLSAGFDKNQILKNISFNVPKGKIVALVGNSGCGKTVTGLSVMGLLKWYGGSTSDGEILYNYNGNTVDITKLSEVELEKIRGSEISMIFQNPQSSLNPIMKIGSQLEEVLKKDNQNISQSDAKDIIYDRFKAVGLYDADRIYNSYPFQLSGGMCQRIMISMCLLSSPSLIIADEPTTFLDCATEAQILTILKNINLKNKCSIIFITHNLKLALEFADNIVVMNNGEIVESGEISEIFNSPKHPFTIRLLNSIY